MAKAPAKTATRTRRPTSEVQSEFSQLREQMAAERETVDKKAAETARLRESEVRQAVDGVSVEAVVQKVSSLGIELSKALSDVSAKLVEQVDQLATVREAVALERAELERLHKIDVAAISLDQLVQDYERQKRTLESEIEMQRSIWEEEQQRTERERKEAEDTLKKFRQREVEEYEYKKSLERKRLTDKYDEEQRHLEKANKEKQEALTRSWAEREAALKSSEQELAELRKQVETFPARIEKEIKQAADAAAKAAAARYEQESALLRKDADAERRISELRIKTLEETIAHQAAQISALDAQLHSSNLQVQEIAVRAIEGASGAKALSHINQIAMEQAKKKE